VFEFQTEAKLFRPQVFIAWCLVQHRDKFTFTC